MAQALKDAKVNPSDVQYINAHGTSTPLNDPNESKGIQAVFGDHATALSISSTKSATGHMLGAAGSVEFIACALAMRDNVVPPTINYQTPDPDCDLDYVPNVARAVRCRHVLKNSFGFGGQNVTLVISYCAA